MSDSIPPSGKNWLAVAALLAFLFFGFLLNRALPPSEPEAVNQAAE
jgi:hypothetical protein